MKNDKLTNESMAFAVDIYKLCKRLKEQREYIISDQIFRSASSVGANIREAQYAASRADFINKLRIALKEANETDYWLELLFKTDNINNTEYRALEQKCRSIKITLINSIKTASQNN